MRASPGPRRTLGVLFGEQLNQAMPQLQEPERRTESARTRSQFRGDVA